MEAASGGIGSEETPAPPEGTAGAGPGGASSTGGAGDGHDHAQVRSREAANYRRRLREAEQERDSLREQLDNRDRAEVERIARGAGLAEPSDLWTLNPDALALLRTDQGTVDSKAVQEMVDAMLRQRPGLRGRPTGDLGVERGAAAAGATRPERIGLSKLLKP